VSTTLFPPRSPDNPLDTIRVLQDELAQTNREVLMLTLELEQRVDDLRIAEERYRRLAENAPDIIYRYELRPERKCAFVNPQVSSITGYSPEEHYADPDLLLRIVHSDERVLMEAILRGECPTGNMATMRWVHKNGALIWIEQHHVLVHGPGGVLLAIEGIARDITERKHLEEQFRQAQKMEAIGRLAGGVAHDFNNLLTVINGYSAQTLSELKKTDPLFEDIEEILKAGERAATLTRQLLAFSRRQVLKPETFDLNEVVADMDRMLRRMLGEDVELITVLAPALDPVHTDRGQIEQVIMNLVVNARDAMPSGGKLIIETAMANVDESYAQQHRSVVPGRYVMFAVSDSGLGMDEATQARIFEPFFTTKPLGQGTGLGLSTVYGIVQQSGGSVWVYSELGKGTTFKIYLPRAAHRAGTAEELHRPLKPAGGSETILVVEDDPSVAKLIRAVLQSNGYRVLEARSAEEALALVETSGDSIQLLVTDIVMPQINGWELKQRLTASRPRLRVLFMSGYTDNAIVQHGLLDPQTPFLQKPFTPTALVAKIREVLDAA